MMKTHGEKLALSNLKKLDDVIIKPSDKGGNLVLMDSIQYKQMCLKNIPNKNWYIPI